MPPEIGMPHKIALALVGALLLVPTGAGTALERDPSRSCATADLVGRWEMVRLVARGSEQIDGKDASFFPHQRFMFFDNGTVQHTTSKQPLPNAGQADSREPVDILAWTVYPDGWLEFQRAGVPYPETCACHYLLRNDRDAFGRSTHRGQVILTYMKNGKPAIQKLLRKVP
jgi:hypothetical protein